MAAAPSAQPFSVMVKPVGSYCNLRCGYCYYLPTPRLGPPRMADETLERLVRSYIAASPGPEVSFVWHGGEPTLAGLDFFRRAVALQQRYAPEGWTCWNNLQTNGVLLDDAWCEFLAANRFDVGLSIDGTRWIHDHYRPDPRGEGSYQAAADAIGRLRAHGVRPDLLCTVTSATAQEPLAVYRNLRSFDTGWIQFIPIVRLDGQGGTTPDSVSGGDYGEFLCTVFDEWVLHDLGRLDVQLFAETTRVLAGGEAGLCWMAPTCGRALVVESDGGVYSCDHFVRPEYRLGGLGETVSEEPDALDDGVEAPGQAGAGQAGGGWPLDASPAVLGALANSDRQREFGDDKRAGLSARCQSCPWLALCNGGCPKDRLTGAPTAAGGDVVTAAGDNRLCEGLSRFFAHAVPQLKQVISMTRHGAVPSDVMAQLGQQAMARWSGVGRNDPCPCGSGKKAKQCCWDRRPSLS